MRASETLAREGLDAFGVNSVRANAALASWVAGHPGGQSQGAGALAFILESLLQKMEAVSDGRSVGFRLDKDEAAVADILIDCQTRFKVRRVELSLRPT